MRFAAILIILLAPRAWGVELSDLSITYRRFHQSARMTEIPGFRAKEGITLAVDISLGGCFFWDNRILSLTDDGGYRFVSWNFFLGCRVFRTLDLAYEHRSGHLLDHQDSAYPGGKFPVNDSINLKWTIQLGERPRPLL